MQMLKVFFWLLCPFLLLFGPDVLGEIAIPQVKISVNAMTDSTEDRIACEVFWKCTCADFDADRSLINVVWETSLERNIDSFFLWKYNNEKDVWYKIVGFQGSDRSDSIRHYQFVDSKIESMNIYRVEMADFDHRTLQSNVFWIQIPSVQVRFVTNPFREHLIIHGADNADHAIEIKVYNSSGQLMYSGLDYKGPIDSHEWPAGMYTVWLKENQKSEVFKVLR